MRDIYDVIIVGGGLVGLTLGLGLARHKVSVAVIDGLDPAEVRGAAFDGRSSAIADASVTMLETLGVWPRVAPYAQPINDILVSDGRVVGRFSEGGAAPTFLHFDAQELRTADGEVRPMGYIVENRLMRDGLYDAIDAEGADGSITLLAPEHAEDVEFGADMVRVKLRSGDVLGAGLCVAADGKFSPLRTQVGIRTMSWGYGQSGLVATVAHEFDHNGLAQEYFLPLGPFAILPMTAKRSSLVWTETTDAAETLMGLPDDAFLSELKRRFGDYLGAVEVAGPRWSYPLSLGLAERYVAARLALVGDAAHAIHPIAGQGFNLGLRDVAALVEVVVEAKRLGQDIGFDTVLARYQQWRRFDALVLGVVTDGLNRLFANDAGPVRLARDLGLAAVNRLGPLRRLLMKHAAGHVGVRPKLLRGVPI